MHTQTSQKKSKLTATQHNSTQRYGVGLPEYSVMVIISISKPVSVLLSGEWSVRHNDPCISSLYSQIFSHIHTLLPPSLHKRPPFAPAAPSPLHYQQTPPPPPSVRSRCWARLSAEVKWQNGAWWLPREEQREDTTTQPNITSPDRLQQRGLLCRPRMCSPPIIPDTQNLLLMFIRSFHGWYWYLDTIIKRCNTA